MALTIKRDKPDPEALYEVVESFSVDQSTYRRGSKVRGDHPAVTAHRARFMPADLDDIEKAAVRREYWGESYARAAADRPVQAPPPVAQRPSGRYRSTGTWTLEDPDLQHIGRITAGQAYDASDPVVSRYWHLFVPERG